MIHATCVKVLLIFHCLGFNRQPPPLQSASEDESPLGREKWWKNRYNRRERNCVADKTGQAIVSRLRCLDGGRSQYKYHAFSPNVISIKHVRNNCKVSNGRAAKGKKLSMKFSPWQVVGEKGKFRVLWAESCEPRRTWLCWCESGGLCNALSNKKIWDWIVSVLKTTARDKNDAVMQLKAAFWSDANQTVKLIGKFSKIDWTREEA